MMFDRSWSDEELLMLAAVLRKSHGGYVSLTRVYGELLIELERRKLLAVSGQE